MRCGSFLDIPAANNGRSICDSLAVCFKDSGLCRANPILQVGAAPLVVRSAAIHNRELSLIFYMYLAQDNML